MESERCGSPAFPDEESSPSADCALGGGLESADSEKVQKAENGGLEEHGKKYIDVVSNRNMKLVERVIIPVKQHPKFNFVGKLLGPRGNSLKRLKEETGTRMSILGKGSMRDKEKEEELRKCGDAKYTHLNGELHVLIEVFAPPAQAYSRMGHALDEVKKYLVPDYNDEIRQEQLRELNLLNGEEDIPVAITRGRPGRGRASHPPPCLPAIARVRVGAASIPMGAATPQGSPATRGVPPLPPLPPLRRGALPPHPRVLANFHPQRPHSRLPPVPAQDNYNEFDYDDGYENGYDETFDGSCALQSESVSEFYEYGHVAGVGDYDLYGQNGWSKNNSHLKAIPTRAMKGTYREHPYGIY
uniref:KH domain-containing, RNA-binding, signal transduction-associated protein 2-like n=1 Tax=Myxine glutinosa TaxID=7769 RepID=UPI00358E1181